MADTSPPPAKTIQPITGPTGEPPAPLVVDANRLAKLLCCCVRTLRTWDAGGKLPAPVRIGGRVLWLLSDITAWLAADAPPRDEWEKRKALSVPRR